MAEEEEAEIEIQVEDKALDRFIQKLKTMNNTLYETSALWGGLTEVAKLFTKTTQAGIAATKLMFSTFTGVVDKSRAFTLFLEKGVNYFERWGNAIYNLARVLGAGGIFGIDRAVQSAFSERKEAKGLGSNPGDLRAFAQGFSSLVDTDQALNAANNAQNDANSDEYRAATHLLKIDPTDVKNMPTADLAALMVKRAMIAAKEEIANGKGDQLFTTSEISGLSKVISNNRLKQLSTTSDEEMNQAQSTFVQKKKDYAITDYDSKKLADLDRAFSDFTNTVTTMMQKLLADLSPQLEAISKDFMDIVKNLTDAPEAKSALQDMLEWFDDKLKWMKKNATWPNIEEKFKEMWDKLKGYLEEITKFFDIIMPYIKSFNDQWGGHLHIAAEQIKDPIQGTVDAAAGLGIYMSREDAAKENGSMVDTPAGGGPFAGRPLSSPSPPALHGLRHRYMDYKKSIKNDTTVKDAVVPVLRKAFDAYPKNTIPEGVGNNPANIMPPLDASKSSFLYNKNASNQFAFNASRPSDWSATNQSLSFHMADVGSGNPDTQLSENEQTILAKRASIPTRWQTRNQVALNIFQAAGSNVSNTIGGLGITAT